METDNLTKFRKIVAGLEPEKREALMARMKGMSKEEAMVMVDRMVELSEQRKIEITARPKVLAGSGREVEASRIDYEVRRPSTYTEIPEDRNIEIVKNPGRRVAAPSNFKPAQHPVKRVEPAVARAGRDQVARQIEYRQRFALLEQEKKARKNALVKKVLRISGKYLGRAMATVLLTLVLVFAGFYVFLGIIMKGPSPHLRNQFVPSVMESSAGGVLARMILTDEEIDSIMNSNKTQVFDEITDTTLVNAMAAEQKKKAEANAAAVNELDPDGDGIEVHDVSGPMYHGKMLVIYDPSRIMVATIDNYNHNGAGLTLKQLIDKYGGVGGINGGQYEDKNGMGIGGWPEGIVISEGKLRMGSKNGTYDVYGLTNENVLVVGRMTAQKALDIGVRDAVSFGPALIVNGVAAKYSGAGGGLNPRTAIGQREDGAILLLVIEGRKTSSMGATMADLIKVMQDYGAVNAANLDGGMSSAMWLYDDELVSSSSVRVSRQMPTAFIILPQKNDASNAGQ
ncbi:exopolysaccharide biosynthesis protein [Ruminococcaceae bacterium R-25]|nr:exopolysaccharide biosynthesis protein [Ruminococcaceae bacterium R-25]SUQ10875.1 Exopolysaccharide biosynthesis protein [Oscillospiraceae bacterium]